MKPAARPASAKKKPQPKKKPQQQPPKTEQHKKLEEGIRYRVALERKTFEIQEALLGPCTSDELLQRCKQYLNPEQYQDVVEERALERICGLPTCPNQFSNTSHKKEQKYRISLKEHKVYDLTENKYYCSESCQIKSSKYKSELSETLVYLRPNIDPNDDIVSAIKACKLQTVQNNNPRTPDQHDPNNLDLAKLVIHEKNVDQQPQILPPKIEAKQPQELGEGFSALPKTGLIKKVPKKSSMKKSSQAIENDEHEDPFFYNPKQLKDLSLSVFGELWTTLSRWCTRSTIELMTRIEPEKQVKEKEDDLMEIEEDKPPEDENKIDYAPPVEGFEPHLVRQKLLFEKLSEYTRLVCQELGMEVNLDSDLFWVVSTFSLYHSIPSLSSVQWLVLALVFVKILEKKVPYLREEMAKPAKEQKFREMIARTGVDPQYEFPSLLVLFMMPLS